jgi:hypothetical protein
MTKLVYHHDPVSTVMGVFDTALRTIVPNEAARQLLQLKGVSEKIVGLPGWYFWFSDFPGAFQLELIGAETRSPSSSVSSVIRAEGSFRIKFYPLPTDATLFNTFSAHEKLIRETEFFDSTGTPAISMIDDFPETLFSVGNLNQTVSENPRQLTLTMEAPDRWVTHVTQGLTVLGSDGQPFMFLGPGAQDRNVPAWTLSWYLTDRLLKILLLSYRTRPTSVSVREQAGSSFWIDEGGTASARPDERLVHRSLTTSISLGHDLVPDTGCNSTRDTDNRCDCQGHLEHNKVPGDKLSTRWISEDWWQIGGVELPQQGQAPC